MRSNRAPRDERTVVLAGGCFWGVERSLGLIPGVLGTRCGYANGDEPNPSYERECEGSSGFAEAVEVRYDRAVLGLSELL